MDVVTETNNCKDVKIQERKVEKDISNSVNDAVTFNTDIETMDQSATTKGSQKTKAALSGIEQSSPFATQRTHAFEMKETDAAAVAVKGNFKRNHRRCLSSRRKLLLLFAFILSSFLVMSFYISLTRTFTTKTQYMSFPSSTNVEEM